MKCSDISVGEYVRNRYGYIGKYTKNSNGIYEIKIRNGLVCRINSKEEIVKHSKEIIDLVQKDDYVNGNKVIDIAQAPVKAVYTEDRKQRLALIPIVNEQIEIVVTKEQIKQIEFRIKE